MSAVQTSSVSRNAALGLAAGVALVWLLTLSCAVPGRGQAADPWIGTRVVMKHGGVQLKVGNQVVDTVTTYRTYRVERVNGPWFWVVSGGLTQPTSGWVKWSEVVPFDQAVDHFTNEIRSNPNSAWAYMMRGLIWSDKQEYEIAIADYNEAIRLDPKDAIAYNNRGNAWSDKKEYDRAIADYNEAI